MSAIVEEKKAAVGELCRRFGILRLELFGSACTPEFDPAGSDLDFLVEFPHGYDFGPWLSRLSELQSALTELFGRHVDLVMPGALRDPWFRREAEKTRTLVYHAPEIPQMA